MWIIFSCLQDDTASNFIAFSGEGQSLRKKDRNPWLHTYSRPEHSQVLFGYFVLFLNYRYLLNMELFDDVHLMFLCTWQMMFYKWSGV